MSALDTAKEIGRMAATATLGKDVIDLLKEKATLLAEQVAALETENTNLKRKIVKLQQELESLRPQTEALREDSTKFLKLLFDRDQASTALVAQELKITQGMADYHRDILGGADLIYEFKSPHGGVSGPLYKLTQKGREYVVKKVLRY